MSPVESFCFLQRNAAAFVVMCMMKKQLFAPRTQAIPSTRMAFQPPPITNSLWNAGLLAVDALSEARGMLDQNEVLTTQCWQCPGGQEVGCGVLDRMRLWRGERQVSVLAQTAALNKGMRWGGLGWGGHGCHFNGSALPCPRILFPLPFKIPHLAPTLRLQRTV